MCSIDWGISGWERPKIALKTCELDWISRGRVVFIFNLFLENSTNIAIYLNVQRESLWMLHEHKTRSTRVLATKNATGVNGDLNIDHNWKYSVIIATVSSSYRLTTLSMLLLFPLSIFLLGSLLISDIRHLWLLNTFVKHLQNCCIAKKIPRTKLVANSVLNYRCFWCACWL